MPIRKWGLTAALIMSCCSLARAQTYGAYGIFPVYESGGQWLIFNKLTSKKSPSPLSIGSRFLVVGQSGSDLFTVARTSATYGAVCREGQPAPIAAALLKGPRRNVGSPVMAIAVPASYQHGKTKESFQTLSKKVDDDLYAQLTNAIKESSRNDALERKFPFRSDDLGADAFLMAARFDRIQMKIDFASRVKIRGLTNPFLLVEESQISSSSRRCMRLADEDKLLGTCVEMPRTLRAETDLLEFVSYDPKGKQAPYILVYTKVPTMWGMERWVFALRPSGPRLILKDAMDIRCRDSF